MKTLSIIILLLYLLQPLACFALPCDSCLGNTDTADTSGKSGSHSQNQDLDSCDTTVCCEENICHTSGINVVYAPLVLVISMFSRYQELPNVVIPIFVPPQSLS